MRTHAREGMPLSPHGHRAAALKRLQSHSINNTLFATVEHFVFVAVEGRVRRSITNFETLGKAHPRSSEPKKGCAKYSTPNP